MKIFGISPNTLNAWLEQYHNGEELERKYRSYKIAVSEEELLAHLRACLISPFCVFSDYFPPQLC
jgi:transposase-like protein